MRKVLITGIAGFTGRHLAKYLSELELEIYGLDLSSAKSDYQDYLKNIIKIYSIDIRKQSALSEIMYSVKPDYLFHLAGLIANKDLKELLEINVLGTTNVLEAAFPLNVKVLIPGSAAEYGVLSENELPATENTCSHPVSNYGISKMVQVLLGYQYYLKNGCPIYIARAFNITGPGEPPDLVCSTIAKQIVGMQERNCEPVLYMGNLETKRDFIDVRDVVKAYWAIINRGIPGEIYNVCSGKAYSIRQIIDIFSKISGISFNIKQDPVRIRSVDVPVMVGANEKIRKQTGWRPEINLNKTLEDLLEYHKILDEV